MSLPADIARCTGYVADGEWREGCEDCLRRTDRSHFPQEVWMEPPPIIAFECEFRIVGHFSDQGPIMSYASKIEELIAERDALRTRAGFLEDEIERYRSAIQKTIDVEYPKQEEAARRGGSR